MVARVPLFSTLDAAEVAEVTKLLYTRLFQAGATIVPAGDPGGAMYFIGSGEATVCVVPGQPIKLHEGDFFGEMALLEHRRHKHDVVADTRLPRLCAGQRGVGAAWPPASGNRQAYQGGG